MIAERWVRRVIGEGDPFEFAGGAIGIFRLSERQEMRRVAFEHHVRAAPRRKWFQAAEPYHRGTVGQRNGTTPYAIPALGIDVALATRVAGAPPEDTLKFTRHDEPPTRHQPAPGRYLYGDAILDPLIRVMNLPVVLRRGVAGIFMPVVRGVDMHPGAVALGVIFHRRTSA